MKLRWLIVARFNLDAELYAYRSRRKNRHGVIDDTPRAKWDGPAAQPRVRATIRGKHAGVYTPTSADRWKMRIAEAWDRTPFVGEVPVDGAIRVDMIFRFCRPRAHYNRHDNLKRSAPADHIVRPDTDNLSKAVLDALAVDADHPHNPWKNDWQVSQLNICKRYRRRGETQGVKVTLYRRQGHDEAKG